MKLNRVILCFFLLSLSAHFVLGSDKLQARAKSLGHGMNVTLLDQYWRGKKENQFSDFLSLKDLEANKTVFKEVKRAGFKSVRIPINFGAWVTIEKPYKWRDKKLLEIPDTFLRRALEAGLVVIVDLHHVEFDGSIKNAATTERISWIWNEISKRYSSFDPDRLLFELRNEPHDMKAEEWRTQAKVLIETVRKRAPKHTLIVGFHNWNSRASLIESKPFEDKNIIYTFHYYDPFLFTHQGATWAGDGLSSVKSVSFPGPLPKSLRKREFKSKWVTSMISGYSNDSQKKKMFKDLSEAKAWSIKHKVPIFMGEFGSYRKFASEASRCRHAKVVYDAAARLKIPNAWWEWDGGFSMFKKDTRIIADCMKDAVNGFTK